ncbi:MAG: sulfatase-like hydrolase/transferase, partial [Gemmatimonadota bacterium]
MTEADLRAGPGALASIGLCFGLVTGLLEVAIQLVRQRMLNRILYVGDAFVWETPVVYGALFLGLAAAIGLVWLVVRNDRARLGVAVFAFAFVSAWSLLLLFPRIHELAAAVLAAGIASRASSIAASGGSVLQRVMRQTLPGAAVLGLVLAGVWLAARRDESRPATTATAREGAPNILLIILDTVRASELGAYGYERPTTPRIDRLAASGALFEAAFSTTSWTLPSHASMFTGRDASALRTNWRTPLEPGVRTLAESLAASDYRTAGFTANLWYTSRATHLNRGFRHYEDYEFTIEQFFKSSSIGQFASRHWPGHAHRRARVHRWINDRRNAADVRAHFLRWLEENDGGSAPFFAFLNFFDAHQPYWAPAEY